MGSKKSKIKHNSRVRPMWMDSLIIAGIVILFAWQWLKSGLPTEDFSGTIAWLWYIKKSLLQSGSIPLWSNQWFCGGSLVLILANFLSFILLLPLSFITEPIIGTKILLIIFHIIAGISAYCYTNYLLHDQDAALFAGVVYSVHPVYIMETALHGHVAVSIFYTFLPFAFYMWTRLLREPGIKRILITGVFFFMFIWLELEKALCVLPFLFLIFVYEILRPDVTSGLRMTKGGEGEESNLTRAFLKNISSSLLTGTITILLSAFFIIPALIEKNYHYLFSKDTIRESLKIFSLSNLLYLVDRIGLISHKITRYLPDVSLNFSGILYLGIVPMILILITGIVWLLAEDKPRNFGIFCLLLIMGISGIGFSSGPYHLWETSWHILKRLFTIDQFLDENTIFILITAGMVIGLIVLLIRCKERILSLPARYKVGIVMLCIAAVSTGLYPSFTILQKIIPLYKHMRTSLSFLITVPVLALSILSSFLIMDIRRRIIKRADFIVAFVLLLIVLLIDFWPYSKYFSREIHPYRVSQLKEVYTWLGKDKDNFRTLNMESYTPFGDLGIVYSGKPSAWAWLNWDSPKRTGEFIFDRLYPRLWHPRGQREAASLAGMANIKYIVDEKGNQPDFIPSENFEKVKENALFSVWENKSWKRFVQVYEEGSVVIGDMDNGEIEELCNDFNPNYDVDSSRISDNEIDLALTLVKPSIVTIAQSWYPGWEVYVDDKPQQLLRVNHAFSGVKVREGKHQVKFRYKLPVYFIVSRIISGMTLITVIVFILVFRNFNVKRDCFATLAMTTIKSLRGLRCYVGGRGNPI